MSIITLITDFGTKDHFVGAIKGAIYTELPTTTIVDITHQITPFNIPEAAYILKNAYKNFPAGTIHIIGVDSELSIENKHLVFVLDGHYFICPDNGLISMITDEIYPTKIIELTVYNKITNSFPVLSVFVKVACHIAQGKAIEALGIEITNYKKHAGIKPKINPAQTRIVGAILYIDNYGNLVSNIHKKMFFDVSKGRPFTIRARRYAFDKIYTNYNDIVDYTIPPENRKTDGDKLVLFNSAGNLEIAIYKSNLKAVGGASSLLGMNYRDTIIITFETDKPIEL